MVWAAAFGVWERGAGAVGRGVLARVRPARAAGGGVGRVRTRGPVGWVRGAEGVRSAGGYWPLRKARTARTRRLSSEEGGRSSLVKMLLMCLLTAFSVM